METMTNVHGTTKWTWANITLDLIDQGKLDKNDIAIDPSSFKPNFFAGVYQNVAFTVTWVKDKLLLVSMPEVKEALINAFAAVVEYDPIASYKRNSYTTVEWDKVDPVGRLGELCNETEFQRL